MYLNTPIEALPGTSSITVRRLKSLFIDTYGDLLDYFPARYEDYSLVSPIAQLQPEEVVTVTGTVTDTSQIYTRRGLKIQKVTIEDLTGKIEVTWYNQPYILTLFKKGVPVSISGIVKKFTNKLSIEPREYEVIKSDKYHIHTGRIVPMYSEKKQLSTKTLREKIFNTLTQLNESIEWLPQEIISFNNLIDENTAYKEIHFPQNIAKQKEASRRLSFDELFTIQLASALVRKEWEKQQVTHAFEVGNKHASSLQQFISNLPFKLTDAQRRVTDEIIQDLQKEKPMNRFVQGDVGSGKTVVAAIGCYIAYLNGFQSLVMAPTEILAQQHYKTISTLLEKYGIEVGLQTGAEKMIKGNSYDVIIGTHALITKKLAFDKVGFVVIDEQHRFGVAQRAMLKEKGINPHLLTMTATPIPRTVSLTLYGELDLSVIDEMPKGRLPIKTYLVPKQKRTDSYTWMKKLMKEQGSQIFIVCPLIEESEIETMKSMKAATKEYERLQNEVFKEYTVSLLHGKMKPEEKQRIMTEFKEKKANILVTTSVVEVGIDIPNASIIVIEGAERFGLAQLHQLRGRVGRGSLQSYCLLFTDSPDQGVTNKLQFFARTTSGMELSEYDMKLRGSGNIFGLQQHGYSNLKIANIYDYDLLRVTKDAVGYVLNNLNIEDYPALQKRLEKRKVDQVSRD